MDKRIPRGVLPLPPPRLFKEGGGIINQKEIDDWYDQIRIILDKYSKESKSDKEC